MTMALSAFNCTPGNANLFLMDASQFVEQRALDPRSFKYNLIMVDVFDRHSIPAQCKSSRFISNLAAMVMPMGAVVMNVDGENEGAFSRLFKRHFADVRKIDPSEDSGNSIFVAFHSATTSSFVDQMSYEFSVDRWKCADT